MLREESLRELSFWAGAGVTNDEEKDEIIMQRIAKPRHRNCIFPRHTKRERPSLSLCAVFMCVLVH